VQDFLCPPDGEGWNQDRSSPFGRSENHIPKLFLAVLAVFVCVKPIAVSGFEDEIFRRLDSCRIKNNRLVVSSQVSCKEDSVMKADERRSKDMTGRNEIKSQ